MAEAKANVDGKSQYAKEWAKVLKVKEWRDDLENPDWREEILESEDQDAAWVRVYTIYETEDPENAEVILGTHGVADPSLYIGAGFVDIEYHADMTPLQLWQAFKEYVLTEIVPTPDSDHDHAFCAELLKLFWGALYSDENHQNVRFHVIDPKNKSCPGTISAKKDGLYNECTVVDEESCLDKFGWSDDDDKIKNVALMRTTHCKEAGDLEVLDLVKPIYRFQKPPQKKIYEAWTNATIKTKHRKGDKGSWETKVLNKAAEIVRDKSKGGKGKRGVV